MRLEPLDLPGVALVPRQVFRDDRGSLAEVFRAEHFAALGLPTAFVQDNLARSRRGVLRGLHWQRAHTQGKLLTVLEGEILDVVADICPESPTFGRHVAVPLRADGPRLWVPEGYAHGFLVLSDEALVLYKNTAPYRPGEGRGVRWDDPDLGIDWGTKEPVLSEADAALPRLAQLPPDDLPHARPPGCP